MKLRPEQLDSALERQLARCYVIFGDEELLVLESADAVRKAAQGQGFTERNVFEADARFDWSEITAAGQAMSLFASRKILDVRLPTGKPGKEGGQVLRDLIARDDPDTLLLLTCGKLDRPTQSTAWFRALEQAGAVVQCWPIRPHELPSFLERRMRAAGLDPEPGAVHALAARVEGNLLAAQQEIDKLAILYPDQRLREEDVIARVADSARFQIFAALEAMLAGEGGRALRMFRAMAAEGMQPVMAAALLSREVRALARLRHAHDKGGNPQAIFRALNIWDSRKPGYERAMRRHGADHWQRCLARCADLDRATKGMGAGEPWQMLEDLVVAVARPRRRA